MAPSHGQVPARAWCRKAPAPRTGEAFVALRVRPPLMHGMCTSRVACAPCPRLAVGDHTTSTLVHGPLFCSVPHSGAFVTIMI